MKVQMLDRLTGAVAAVGDDAEAVVESQLLRDLRRDLKDVRDDGASLDFDVAGDRVPIAVSW